MSNSYLIRKSFLGYRCESLHGGSLENTLTVPFKGVFINFLNLGMF